MKVINLRVKRRQRESDLMQKIEDRLRELLPNGYPYREEVLKAAKDPVPMLMFETEEELRRYEKENGLEKNVIHVIRELKAGEVIPWMQEKSDSS